MPPPPTPGQAFPPPEKSAVEKDGLSKRLPICETAPVSQEEAQTQLEDTYPRGPSKIPAPYMAGNSV